MWLLNAVFVASIIGAPVYILLGLAMADTVLYQIGKYLFLVGILGFFLTIKGFPWYRKKG